MGRQATIVNLSCRNQAYESLQKRWANSEEPGFVFLVESYGDRLPANDRTDAPLYIIGDSGAGSGQEFLRFARELLLFPEPLAQKHGSEPLAMDYLQLGCGPSSVCCLRAGRVLAEFLFSRGAPGELLILEPEDVRRSEKPGAILTRILRARNHPAGMERLARSYPSYFFLAAGFVSGPLRHADGPSALQDFGNQALQHCEN